MSEQLQSVFPAAFGVEEEVRGRLNISSHKKRAVKTFEPDRHTITKYIAEAGGSLPGNYGLLEGGGRTYCDDFGPEMCTPECDTPEQTTRYVHASAEILERGLGKFAGLMAGMQSYPYVIELARRVIGDDDETWGCHDNLSIQKTGMYYDTKFELDKRLGKLWYDFLTSRAFMTGAGLIRPGNPQFSQKLSVPHTLYGAHSSNNTMVRFDNKSGDRLEIRCSDINLKDWSCESRLGGAALFLAATLTPLRNKLQRLDEFGFDDHHTLSNRIPIDDDFHFRATGSSRHALDLQRATLTTILDELEDAANEAMPPELRRNGEAQLRFCDEYEAVLENRSDLDILASRADWAQKLSIIRADTLKRPKGRHIGDERSRGIDNLYDRSYITAERVKRGVKVTHKPSYGHRIAREQSTIPDEAIERAITTPPPNSRAERRVKFIKEKGRSVIASWWDSVQFRDKFDVEVQSFNLTPRIPRRLVREH